MAQVKDARTWFHQKYPTLNEQRKFVLEYLERHNPSEYNATDAFIFEIFGIVVCWKAWISVYGITQTRYYYLKDAFLGGVRNVDHGLLGTKKDDTLEENVYVVMKRYFEMSCEFLPHTQLWHLPSHTTLDDIRKEIIRELEKVRVFKCSQATIRSVWKKYFPKVKIPKVHITLM